MKYRFPPRRILVGFDLSEPSIAALRAAVDLSKRLDARLTVAYVEPPPIAQVPDGLQAAALVASEEERQRLRALWKKKVLALTAGLEPKLFIEQGLAEAVLAKKATARSADLVVLGTHGRQGGQRLFLGSVAESVVHRAKVPVLTVRAGKAVALKRILAPCHLRNYADEALYYAIKLGEAVHGEVVVLYVAAETDWEIDAELRVRLHLEETFGSRIARKLRLVIRRGEPRQEILKEAAGGYDLVALSAHRRGALSDLALGSTAERTLRGCALPLLAVPALNGGSK